MSGVRESFSLRERKVFVAGHTGMAGAAIVRRLARERCEVLTAARGVADLRRRRQEETQRLLDRLHYSRTVCAFVDKTAQLDAMDRESLRMVFKDETRSQIPLPLPALRPGRRQAN